MQDGVEFSASEAWFFRGLLELDIKSRSELAEHLAKKLGSLGADEWSDQIEHGGDALEMARELRQQRLASPSLGAGFQDAVERFADALARDGAKAGELEGGDVKDWLQLLTKQGQEETRVAVVDRVIETSKEQGGRAPSDAFFRVFGEEIAAPEMLKARSDIERLFREIIRGRSLEGVRWMHRIVSEAPGLLSELEADAARKDTVKNIYRRITGTLRSGEAGEELSRELSGIATAVGLTIAEVRHPSDKPGHEVKSAQGEE
jgi:hypothetical protein